MVIDEIKKQMAHFDSANAEFERRRKELISVKMKMGLEGFRTIVDKFEVAPELVFRKAPLDERKCFYGRTHNAENAEI